MFPLSANDVVFLILMAWCALLYAGLAMVGWMQKRHNKRNLPVLRSE